MDPCRLWVRFAEIRRAEESSWEVFGDAGRATPGGLGHAVHRLVSSRPPNVGGLSAPGCGAKCRQARCCGLTPAVVTPSKTIDAWCLTERYLRPADVRSAVRQA